LKTGEWQQYTNTSRVQFENSQHASSFFTDAERKLMCLWVLNNFEIKKDWSSGKVSFAVGEKMCKREKEKERERERDKETNRKKERENEEEKKNKKGKNTNKHHKHI